MKTYVFTFERPSKNQEGMREVSEIVMAGKDRNAALNRAKRTCKERDGWKLVNDRPMM